jgi:hypothetical protein
MKIRHHFLRGNRKSKGQTQLCLKFVPLVAAGSQISGMARLIENMLLKIWLSSLLRVVILMKYDTFYNIYGIDIKFEYNGNVRPQGSGWDIGAYEYVKDTGILRDKINIPTKLGLHNYPNPFNPTTMIKFEIAARSRVRLEISDINGRKVTTLVDRHYNAGKYALDWNVKDQDNMHVSSSMYLYRLMADGLILTEKMLLIR